MATPNRLEQESIHWATGTQVIGVDEAGRGCLAGPVVAGAVLFHHPLCDLSQYRNLRDSKKLSKRRREHLFATLEMDPHVEIGVATVDCGEIDRINILCASMKAMREAVGQLEEGRATPVHVLVDGNQNPYAPKFFDGTSTTLVTTLVKGDDRSLSIAAGSVIAKVTRDRQMRKLAGQHPGYGWERNAGYGTKEHREKIKALGLTPYHRKTFRGCSPVLQQPKVTHTE